MEKERPINRFSFLPLLALPLLSLLAFTQAQKNWIRRRDQGKCQAPFQHDCNMETKGGEIHHILCSRYAKEVGIENPDIVTNALLLCEESHTCIHPDRRAAKQTYHVAKQHGVDTFQELFTQRDEKLRNRQIYWNAEHDRQMTVVALRNTQQFIKNGAEPFPERKSKDEH
jgi:hypothetical protein